MTTFEFEKFKVNAMPYEGDKYLCTVHLHNGFRYKEEVSECFTVDRCDRELVYSLVSPAAKNGKDKVGTLIECAQDLTRIMYEDVYEKSEDHTQALQAIATFASEFEDIWWGLPEDERNDYLSTLEEYAQGLLVDVDELNLENRNIYQILTINGIKQVKMLGYFYKAEPEWRLVEFSQFYLPIKELNKMSMDYLDELESSVPQYITDYKGYEENKVLKTYLSYHATPLPYDLLSEDTPEGIYITI